MRSVSESFPEESLAEFVLRFFAGSCFEAASRPNFPATAKSKSGGGCAIASFVRGPESARDSLLPEILLAERAPPTKPASGRGGAPRVAMAPDAGAEGTAAGRFAVDTGKDFRRSSDCAATEDREATYGNESA